MAQSHGIKPIITDGLIFYVDAKNTKCYSGSGTTVTDLASANTGTLTNGPTFNSNGYWDFDGSNDYLDTGFEPTNANSQNGYAWGYWFYFDDIGTRGLNGFRSGNAGRIYAGHIDSGNFFVGCGDKYNTNLTGSTAISIENWFYIVNTYNGDGTAYFYINADLKGTLTGITFSIDGSDGNLVLGQLNNNGTIVSGYPANGKSGLAHFYNKYLTASEVSQNFNAQRSRFGV